MSVDLWLWNTAAWSAQVMLMVLAAALLLRLLAVRDPGVRLALWQLTLLACVLLPGLQPWRQDVIPVPAVVVEEAQGRPVSVARTASAGPAWQAVLVWGLILGGIARLGWLMAGLVRLRSLRRRSALLDPVPEAVLDASTAAGMRAEARVSDEVAGPVTFGLSRPVIIFPPGFAAMNRQAQFALACHECRHVKRKDWLFHLAEEAAASLLWFHPAAWWMVGRIRLCREQVVDREVVALTGARESYVELLLDAAGSGAWRDLIPAQTFLRRRHLTQRVLGLMKETTMSMPRMIASCGIVLAGLGACAWFAATSFPLWAAPQVREAMQPDSPGVMVTPGARLLHRKAVQYPPSAIRNRVEGSVLVEAALDGAGNVSDARVISGPAELRKAALESVLGWHFADSAGSAVRISVDFRLSPEVPVQPPPASGRASRSNPSNVEPARDEEVSRGTITGIDMNALPVSLRDKLEPLLAVYAGRPFNRDNELRMTQAVRAVDSHVEIGWQTRIGPDGAREATMFLSLERPAFPLPEKALELSTATQFAPPEAGMMRIRVGGNQQAQKLTSQVRPVYPPLAKQARIQGTVRFSVLIDREGRVKAMQLVNGHPLLTSAAQEAVKDWVYQTTLLNGNPVEVITAVDVNFTLAP